MKALQLLILGVAATLPAARAAIVYTPGMGIEVTSGLPGRGTLVQDLDFNGDGSIDLYFRSTIGSAYRLIPFPETEHRVLAIRIAPPESGQYAVQLHPGDVIGAPIPPETWWGIADRRNSFDYGPVLWDSLGDPWGATQEELYVGVQLNFDGQIHYGWIGIKLSFLGGTGDVTGWAYETEPNKPIFAGEVPEPSTLLLGAAASIVFLRRRRHHPPPVE